MTDDTIKKLEQRVSDLETKLKNEKPAKPPRPPRKPSEYNKFVADYISKNKDDKKSHKVLFSEAVSAWNEKKK